MATLHINLDELISKKIEEKLDAILDKQLSNIKIDSYLTEKNSPSYESNEDSDGDYCYKDKKPTLSDYIEDEDTKSFDEQYIAEDKKENNTFQEIEPTDNPFMNYLESVTASMKRLLSEQYSHYYGTIEVHTTDEEKKFNNYLKNFSLVDLKSLLNNEKVGKSISDVERQDIEEMFNASQKALDIYYDLVKMILKEKLRNILNINYTENDDTYFEQMLASELWSNIDSTLDVIIMKYNKEIFDYLFGPQYYLG